MSCPASGGGSLCARTRGTSTRSAGQISIDERDRLVLVARHDVPVAVERDLDRAVAEVGGERLGVDAGRDQDRRERVPTFVQTDRIQARLLPRSLGSLDQHIAVERPAAIAEEEAGSAASPQLPSDQVASEDDNNRYGTLAH